VGVKSPLFRIDKAMKAVQEALLDGELGEEVREGREQEEGGREKGRNGFCRARVSPHTKRKRGRQILDHHAFIISSALFLLSFSFGTSVHQFFIFDCLAAAPLTTSSLSPSLPPFPASPSQVGDPLEFVDASQRVLDGIKNADFLGKAEGRKGGREGRKEWIRINWGGRD
jgi:hypothetical protein